jgi:replication fork clamp-binding protein CrfC
MIADNYLQLRTELETALGKLLRLSSEMRRDSATLDTLQGLLRDIREPLLFVVVGEVKAGKSSLLNALFGQEFAKVDVLPATDRVYIFRHGVEEKSVEVSAQLTERYLPIPFLVDFNARHQHHGAGASDDYRRIRSAGGYRSFCFLGH